jgi:hypothetical protein
MVQRARRRNRPQYKTAAHTVYLTGVNWQYASAQGTVSASAYIDQLLTKDRHRNYHTRLERENRALRHEITRLIGVFREFGHPEIQATPIETCNLETIGGEDETLLR